MMDGITAIFAAIGMGLVIVIGIWIACIMINSYRGQEPIGDKGCDFDEHAYRQRQQSAVRGCTFPEAEDCASDCRRYSRDCDGDPQRLRRTV